MRGVIYELMPRLDCLQESPSSINFQHGDCATIQLFLPEAERHETVWFKMDASVTAPLRGATSERLAQTLRQWIYWRMFEEIGI